MCLVSTSDERELSELPCSTERAGDVHLQEFWQELTTGRIYAIELTDGVVTGSCGPLSAVDLDPTFLTTYRYSTVGASALERRRESFVPMTESEILLRSAAAD